MLRSFNCLIIEFFPKKANFICYLRKKGVDVLLRAFALARLKIPQARLLIAGDGTAKENFQILCRELNIVDAVKWLGYLPQLQMEKHFEGAWVQAVPSQWQEPFGNVTTEAMMRGTAVIASAVGAQPEIVVDRKTGFLINDYSNVECWTSSLISLLSNRQLASDMGQVGRERALTEFSEDRRDRAFLEIYHRLISKYHLFESELAAPS